MKHLKKIIITLLLAAAVYSCSDAPPATSFCVRNESGSNLWVCLGTFNGTSYTAVSNWVSVADGEISNDVAFTAGTYYICYDWDNDHSSIKTPAYEYDYISGVQYTIYFAADGKLYID